MNPLYAPTLTLSACFFLAGAGIYAKTTSRKQRVAAITVSSVLAIPGVLFAAYYTHLFDNAIWFYEFKSIPYTELLASGAGFLTGILAHALPHRTAIKPLLFVILLLGISIPHVKPLISPAQYEKFHDTWDNDVCLQSTGYSCGPACAATLLKTRGQNIAEKTLAKECNTYSGGTENWYIARAFRKRGVRVRYVTGYPLPRPLPTPSIAGVRLGSIGHFVALLEENEQGYVVADPLQGKSVHSAQSVTQDFDFTGFFLVLDEEEKPETERPEG